MKKIGLIALLFLALSSGLKAQWLRQTFNELDYLSVHITSADTAYVLGPNSSILRTIDGGNYWVGRYTNPDTACYDIWFTDNLTGYMVGFEGSIFKTFDGGQNWSLVNSGSTWGLRGVQFVNPDTGYVVGSQGTILKTVDAGLNWSLLNSTSNNTLLNVFFLNEDTGYVGSTSGEMLYTNDGGANWTVLVTGFASSCISFPTPDTGYAAAFGYVLRKTIDGGTTWTSIIGSGGNSYGDVHFFDAWKGIITTAGAKAQMTTDGGQNWTDLVPDMFGEAFSFLNDSVGYLVGRDGRIYKTTDQANSWTPRDIISFMSLDDVVFTDSEIGYAVGAWGTMLKTPDAGKSWWPMASGTTKQLHSVFFTNDSIGFVSGDFGWLIRTTDAGSTWDSIYTGSNEHFFRVHFLNDSTGFLVSKTLVLQTVDGGSTWDSLSTFPFASASSISFVNDSVYYATSYSSYYFKSVDGGQTWTLDTLDNGVEGGLYFLNDSVAYSTGGLHKTVDGGATWAAVNIDGKDPLDNIASICFVHPDTGFAVGEDGLILKTMNGGVDWFSQTCADISTLDLSKVYFTNDKVGIIVGRDGVIIRTTDLGEGVNLPPEITEFINTTFFSAPLENTVKIAYKLLDNENDVCSVLAEYSLDGGATWGLATEITGANGTTNRRAIQDGKWFNYYWNSVVDGIGLSGSVGVVFRITPSDNQTGTSFEDTYYVDNSPSNALDWDEVDSKIAANYQSMSFASSGVGYALGGTNFSGNYDLKQVIIKTVNNGKTWSEVSIPISTRPGPSSIFAISPDTVFLAGSLGYLYRTYDGCDTWEDISIGTQYQINDVQFTSNSTGYMTCYSTVGGNYNGLLKTIDGGNTWFEIGPSFQAKFSDFISDSVGVSKNGYTTDGGLTWTGALPNITCGWNEVKMLSDSSAYICGWDCFGYTVDGGTTWTINSALGGYEIDFINENIGFMLSGWGLATTHNTGVTWAVEAQVPNVSFTEITMLNDTVGLMLADYGTIIRTVNGGGNELSVVSNVQLQSENGNVNIDYTINDPDGDICSIEVKYSLDSGMTWLPLTNGTGGDGTSNIFANGQQYTYAWNTIADQVGIDCFIQNVLVKITPFDMEKGIADTSEYSTIDNSHRNQWEVLTSGSTEDINAVSFASETIGVAVGKSGTILRTTSGGDSWVSVASGTSDNLMSVFFSNDNTAYAMGAFGRILKTIDTGATWNEISHISSAVMTNLYFVNKDTGYAVGGFNEILASIYKTTDGGLTWTSQVPNTTYQLETVFFVNENVGYAAGNFGIIINTVDGGANWVNQSTWAITYGQDISFVNADSGIVVGNDSEALNTSNGGSDWDVQGNTRYTLNGLYFQNNIGYAVGSSGLILSTTNLGECWATEVTGVTEELYDVFFVSDVLGFAVGDNGMILRTTFQLPDNLGCTDSNYVEYNPNATIDDGSCQTLVNWNCVGLSASFIQSVDTLILSETDSVFFTNTSAGDSSWTWDFGNGFTDTLEDAYTAYDSLGTYTVTLIVDNGLCTDTFTSSVVVVQPIGMYTHENKTRLLIYPNPNTGSIKISVTTHPKSELNVGVYHLDGREVFSVSLISKSGNYYRQLDLSDFAKGIYFIQLRTENEVLTKKIVYQ